MKDTTPTKVELLQHIQELQDMLAKAQRGVEPIGVVTASDGKVRWNIDTPPIGTKLYAAPQRTAAAGTPESGIDSIPNSMSCQPTASTPRTTGLDEVLEYYDPIAARAPVDDCEYDFVMTAAEYRVIRDEIDNAAQLRAELSKHQESEFHPDWSMLQATRESLREHQEIIVELRAALEAERKARAEAESREGLVCGDCPNGEGWLYDAVEGRYPCTCMTEAEPYQLLEQRAEAAEARVWELENKHD